MMILQNIGVDWRDEIDLEPYSRQLTLEMETVCPSACVLYWQRGKAKMFTDSIVVFNLR